MDKNKEKRIRNTRRHKKVRAKIVSNDNRPRLSVFRSNKAMFIQIIDDVLGVTLVSAASSEVKAENKTKTGFELGKLIAKKAQDKKITKVVFDRGSYRYHGRVKAVAEGAREGGLEL